MKTILTYVLLLLHLVCSAQNSLNELKHELRQDLLEFEKILKSRQDLYYINTSHLPNVPSEKEVLRDGVDLGEMNATLLRKIEELYLHVIELEKEVEVLKFR